MPEEQVLFAEWNATKSKTLRKTGESEKLMY